MNLSGGRADAALRRGTEFPGSLVQVARGTVDDPASARDTIPQCQRKMPQLRHHVKARKRSRRRKSLDGQEY